MMVSKINYLTPQVLNLLPIEDYQTKRFIISNNLIGLPVSSIFTQYALNFEPLAPLSNKIHGNLHLYSSVNQQLIIPECKFYINENGLITKFIESSGRSTEFEYDEQHRRIYQKWGWPPYSRTYFTYCDDIMIGCLYNNGNPVRKEPSTIQIFNKFGFLQEVKDAEGRLKTGSKYDIFSNIIESRKYIYKNIYRTDVPDLLDRALIIPKGETEPQFKMQYIYDDWGNWTSRTITNLSQFNNSPTIENRRLIYKNNRLYSIMNDRNTIIFKIKD